MSDDELGVDALLGAWAAIRAVFDGVEVGEIPDEDDEFLDIVHRMYERHGENGVICLTRALAWRAAYIIKAVVPPGNWESFFETAQREALEAQYGNGQSGT